MGKQETPPGNRTSMTALSQPEGKLASGTASFVVARLSHWLSLVSRSASIAMTVCSGCWIGDPPEYGDPVRIPPILDAEQAVPPLSSLHVYEQSQIVDVSVPFRSEDNGDPPVAFVFADYTEENRKELGNDLLQSPSYFADPAPRSFSIQWAAGELNRGCYRISLIAYHWSNRGKGNLPIDGAEKSVLDWWVEITRVGETSSYTLGSCRDTDGSVAQ